jgi:hypothetical protein
LCTQYREGQVEAAAVDVELVAEVAPGHRRALDVPAGTAAAPRRGPVGVGRLVGLEAFPEGEVTVVALVRLAAVVGRPHLVRVPAGQRAVLGVGGDVEVDVAVAGPGRVRTTARDQLADELVHLRDVPGGQRLVRRRQHVQRAVVGVQDQLVLERDGPERPLLRGRLVQDLVVHIRDVADERHVVAGVQQPAAQDVVGDAGAQVTDVRDGLHRQATQVDADLTGRHRDEVPDGSGRGVMEAQRHRTRVPTSRSG